MRALTIELGDDVFSFLELRAAIDDLRIKEGVELFLTELVTARKEGRKIIYSPPTGPRRDILPHFHRMECTV